jgi:hypothetical protein
MSRGGVLPERDLATGNPKSAENAKIGPLNHLFAEVGIMHDFFFNALVSTAGNSSLDMMENGWRVPGQIRIVKPYWNGGVRSCFLHGFRPRRLS